MLSYWFYPNPGNAHYGNPKVIILLALCVLLFASSFVLSLWRNNHPNSQTRKLSRSWPKAMRWFALIGLILVVSRVEEIQFLAMRALWALWVLLFLGYAAFEIWKFHRKHYTVVPSERVKDPRQAYLP